MSITIDNGDGTYTVLAGHPVGIKAYFRAMERTKDINEISRYKIGQKLRIKNDYAAVLNFFLSYDSLYRFGEAEKLARYLIGKDVQVISPDMLFDFDGKEKIFYTVSLDTGEFHVMPEHLLEEI